MKNKLKATIICLAFAFVLGCPLCLYFGILQINNPSQSKYPIHGVDVSSYQGNIDWKVLADQGIDFAFIKATEGSAHVDSQFETNWKNASKTELAIGAYHFFSFDSSGSTQAEHFISTVPREKGTLPPVIDIEFYADKETNPPSADEVIVQLSNMISALESHYGVAPIIYATEKSYDLYIKDYFPDSPLWIRSVYGKPDFLPEERWLYWQYSNRKVLRGYDGTERYIDMNVFKGSNEDFSATVQ